LNIKFIPKRAECEKPWVEFGCEEPAEYNQWVPHICGICCLKMVLDSICPENSMSLYSLTIYCYNLSGFRIMEDGSISGVFHHPLLELARSRGLDGKVFRDVEISSIITEVQEGNYVILSINLELATKLMSGSHLILIHAYDDRKEEFIFHDCSQVLDSIGSNLRINHSQLTRISNKKGIVLWKSVLY